MKAVEFSKLLSVLVNNWQMAKEYCAEKLHIMAFSKNVFGKNFAAST